MKLAALGKIPWDMVVFLTVTSVGLGVAYNRVGSTSGLAGGVGTESNVQSGVLDVGCVDRKPSHERTTFVGSQVRIKGQICDLPRRVARDVGGIRVRNLTAEAEGTVFLQGTHSKFVSGSLQLLRGKNQIQVEWNDPVTKKEKSVTLELIEP